MSEPQMLEQFCLCGHTAIEHMELPWILGVCLRRDEIGPHPCECKGWVLDDTLSEIMALKSLKE
jgi:hypothetical protein